MRILLRDLSPGTTYQIQLRARDDAGNVSEWSRVFPMTTTADTVAPNTPTGVAGTMSGTSFNLSWSPVTTSFDGTPAHDLDRYEVKVESGGTGTNATYVVKDSKFQFDFEMNRQLFGTARANIIMSVRAVDTVGNASPFSSQVNQTNAAPAAVTGLTATAQTDAILLKWNANTDSDLQSYEVHLSTTGSAGTYTKVWEGYTTSMVQPSTNYLTDHWFRVYAKDVFTTLSTATQTGAAVRPNSPFAVDSTAPGVPTGLTATLNTSVNAVETLTSALVSWTAVADTDGDLAGYKIGYRSVGSSDWQYTDVDYTNTSTKIDRLTPYVNYELRIRSYDFSANYSAWSSTFTTSTAATNSAPAAPTGLSATFGKEGITAKWTENSEADVANGAGTYEVDIATNSGFTTGLLTYRTGATSITVSGLAQGQAYWVRVRAVDNQGLASTNSGSVTGTTGTISNFKYTTSASAPSSPTTGDIWMDTGTGFEKQWSGSAWVNTGNASIAYVNSQGTDLVTNGNGTLLTNYNFPGTTFLPTDTPTGTAGSFLTPANNNTITTSENMPVDPNKTYKFGYQLKQTGSDNTGRAYGGLAPYDIAGLSILPQNYMFQSNTTTTLAADLVPGATTVQLTSAANWNNAAGVNSHLRTLIFWGYTDRNGKNWGDRTYSREVLLNAYADGAISGNTITLSAPWAGFTEPGNSNIRTTIPAGTVVSNGSSGGNYMYGGAVNTIIPQAWTYYSATYAGLMPSGSSLTGQTLAATTAFPPGTAYVRIIYLPNRNAGGAYQTNSFISIAGVSLSDAGAAYDLATTANASANGKNKVVHSLSAASGTTGFIAGDTWFQYDGSNNVIAQWRFTGSAWQSEQVGSAVIANLDAGKLTANSAFVTTLNVGAGGVIQSAGYTGGGTSGFQLSTSGLTIKGTGNSVAVESIQTGTISAKTLTIGATGVINVDSTGVIKSNNYAAGSTGYQLGNAGLELNDGTVDAKTLKTGSAIIGDLTIGRSADALGTIKSFDYSAGTAGWKIGKGLFEINQGTIKAAALQLQSSPNLMPPAFADFEYTDGYYISGFWFSRGQGKVYVNNGITDGVFTTNNTERVKGTRYFGFSMPFNTNPSDLYWGASNTDYNVSVEPGKTYIWSIYARNRQANAETGNWLFKGDNGTVFQTTGVTFGAAETGYTRRSVAVTIPAGVNKIIIGFQKLGSTNNTDFWFDCAQFEEKTGTDNTPSVWKPPGATTIDGSGIVTGMIRAQNDITVSGTSLPAWSINMAGNIQVGDALVRGKLIVGTGTEGLPNRAPGNGDFETNTTGYQVYQSGATGTSLTRTTTGGEVITGTGSAKVVAAAGAKTSLGISFNTPMVYPAGTELTISANVKVNTTDASSTINIDAWNSSIAVIDSSIAVPANPVANTVYNISWTYVVPSGQDVATFSIQHFGGTATSFIIDDIVLTADNEQGTSYVQSANFVSGSGGTGWQIDGQGNVEFNQGVFRGTLGANTVTAESLSSTITMSTVFRTGESGQRVQFSQDGIVAYKPDDTLAVQIPTDGVTAASFDGDLLASSLTISDQLAIRGSNNEISKGATVTLAGATTSPSSPVTISIDWKTIPAGNNDGFGPYRYGLAKQGGWWRIPVALYGVGTVVESYDITTGNKQWGSLATNTAGGANAMWYPSGGITAIGNNVYMLGTDKSGNWRLAGWTFSTAVSGTPTSLFNVAYQKNSDHYVPALGTDGTNLLITYTSNINQIVGYYTHSASTGARIGTFVTSNGTLKMSGDMAFINKGTFGGVYGGATVFIVGGRNYTNGYVLNSSFQYLGKYTFPLISKPAGQFWDGTKLYTYDNLGYRITEHTDFVWDSTVSGMGTWNVVNTWYDSSTAPLSTIAVTNKALTSNVATLTTGVVHGFTTGNSVTVTGVDATFNGVYTITSTPTTTTFTYAKTAANVTSVASGGAVGITGTTHQTSMGPIKSFAMKQRARFTVTTAPIPVRPIPNTNDDAVATAIYLARSATIPTRQKFERLEVLPDNVRTKIYESMPVALPLPGVDASVAPPVTSDFPDSAPSLIRSANDKIILGGDGTITLGDLTLPSGQTYVKALPRQYTLSLSSGWVTYGSPFGTPRAYRGLDGAWVITGLVKRSGANISVPTAGVTFATIPSSNYASAISQISGHVATSNAANNLVVQMQTDGSMLLRPDAGTAVTFATNEWFTVNGLVFHEAAN